MVTISSFTLNNNITVISVVKSAQVRAAILLSFYMPITNPPCKLLLSAIATRYIKIKQVLKLELKNPAIFAVQ